MRKAYLILALLLSISYLALRVTHQVRYVSVLSGTLPFGESSLSVATAHAGVYVLLHFAFVLLVPSLLLATLLDLALTRTIPRK